MRVSIESWKQHWYQSQARISFRTELPEQFGHNWSTAHDPFRLWLNFKVTSCSIWNFWTESILNERPALKLILTSTSTDSGKEDYTKVVDNFDSSPESINTPLVDKQFRSNGLWNLRGAAGNSRFLDRLTRTDPFGIWVFIPSGNWGTQNTKIEGVFLTFSKKW
jgi:hypothetical protein